MIEQLTTAGSVYNMKTLQKANDARLNNILEKHCIFRGQVMKRIDILNQLISEGRKLEVQHLFNKPEFDKDEKLFKFLSNKYILGLSNENLPDVQKLRAIKEKREARGGYNTKLAYCLVDAY